MRNRELALVATGRAPAHTTSDRQDLRARHASRLIGRQRALACRDRARHSRRGLTATCLRPLFFMQNLAFQVKGMRRDGVLRGAIEDASIAMVDARDIAAVAAVALLGNTAIEGRR